MAIFRAEKGVKIKNVVITFPPKIVEYLSIYSISRGYARSKLLREIITRWYEEMLGEQSLETVYDVVVQKVYEIWQTKKSRYEDFEEYLDQLQRELSFRRSPIDDEAIKIIVQKLYEKEQEDRTH